jgi:hypothetical protein
MHKLILAIDESAVTHLFRAAVAWYAGAVKRNKQLIEN